MNPFERIKPQSNDNPFERIANKNYELKKYETDIQKPILPTIEDKKEKSGLEKALTVGGKVLGTVASLIGKAGVGALKYDEAGIDKIATNVALKNKAIDKISSLPDTVTEKAKDFVLDKTGLKNTAIGNIVDKGQDVFGNVSKNASKTLLTLPEKLNPVTNLLGSATQNISEENSKDFIKKEWVEDYVGKPNEEFRENYSYLPKGVGNFSEAIGNTIPPLLLGGVLQKGATIATQGASKAAQYLLPKVAGILPFVNGVAGQSSEEALNKGASLEQAGAYAAMNGAVEGAIEMISGGLGGVMEKTGSKVVQKAIGKEAIYKISQNIIGKYGLKLLEAGIDVTGEGFEEVLSSTINPYLKRLTYDEKAELATKPELIESFIGGILMSTFLKGGNAILTGNTQGGTLELPTIDTTTQNQLSKINENLEYAKQNEQLANQQINDKIETYKNKVENSQLALPSGETYNGVNDSFSNRFVVSEDGQIIDKKKFVKKDADLQSEYDSVSNTKDTAKKFGKAVADMKSQKPLMLDDGSNFYGDKQKNTVINGSNYLPTRNDIYKNTSKTNAEKQFEIIKNSNPANDDVHTWIRNEKDIKTFEETLKDTDYADYVSKGFDPDYTGEMISEALKTGEITVYSSYPIEQGIFVSPSKMEAQSYSGNGNVYSKKVKLNDIAWIDPTQGQYAKIQEDYPTNVTNPKMKYAIGKNSINVLNMGTKQNNNYIPKSDVKEYKSYGRQKFGLPTISDVKESPTIENNNQVEQVIPNNNKTAQKSNMEATEASNKKLPTKAKNNEAKQDIESDIVPDVENETGYREHKIRYNDTVYRVARQALGEKGYNFIKNKVLDPFDQAKADYVKEKNELAYDLKKNVVDKYNIKKGSRDSYLIQKYGEKQMTLEELQQKSPNNWKNIVEADKYFRAKYNELIDKLNESRKMVYPNVERDIAEVKLNMNKSVSILLDKKAKLANMKKDTKQYTNLKNQITRLNERIKGYEEKLNSDELWRGKRIPKREDYYHHFQEMTTGFEKLHDILSTVPEATSKNSIFTKPNSKFLGLAQKRKGNLTKFDAVGGMLKYIEAASYAIHIDPEIKNIRDVSKQIRSYNTEGESRFANFIDSWADTLSGKSAPIDAGIKKTAGIFGEKTLAASKWLANRIKKNAVLGNVNSSFAQILNIPQGFADIKNVKNILQGVAQTVSEVITPNTKYENSQFIQERFNSDIMSQFNTRLIDQPEKFAKWMLGALDEFGTKAIWNGEYAKAVDLGEKNPVKYADDHTRDLVGGRGIGEKSLVQESDVVGVLAPFTLETSNYMNVMKDMIDKKDIGGLILLAVYSHLINKALEAIGVSGRTMDLIQAVKDASETDGILPKVGRATGEVLNSTAWGQVIAGLYPEYGADFGVFELPDRKTFFGEGDPTRYGTGNIFQKALSSPQDIATSIITPFGGTQIKRTIDGGSALVNGRVTSTDKNTGKEKLKYDLDMENKSLPQKAVQAAQVLTLGRNSTKQAQEYFDRGSQPLSGNLTEWYDKAKGVGITQKQFYNAYDAQKNVAGYDKLNSLVKKNKIDEATKGLNSNQRKVLYEAFGVAKSEWSNSKTLSTNEIKNDLLNRIKYLKSNSKYTDKEREDAINRLNKMLNEL